MDCTNASEAAAVSRDVTVAVQGQIEGIGGGCTAIAVLCDQIRGIAGYFIHKGVPGNGGTNQGIVPSAGLSAAVAAAAVDDGCQHPKPGPVGNRGAGAINGKPGTGHIGNEVVRGKGAEALALCQSEAIQHPANIGIRIIPILGGKAAAGDIAEDHAAAIAVVAAAHHAYIAAHGGQIRIIPGGCGLGGVGNFYVIDHCVAAPAPADYAAKEAGIRVGRYLAAGNDRRAVFRILDGQILDHTAPAELDQAAKLAIGLVTADGNGDAITAHDHAAELLVGFLRAKACPVLEGEALGDLVIGVAQIAQHFAVVDGACIGCPVVGGAGVHSLAVPHRFCSVCLKGFSGVTVLLRKVAVAVHYRDADLDLPAGAGAAVLNGLGKSLQLLRAGDDVGVGIGAAAHQQVGGDQVDIQLVNLFVILFFMDIAGIVHKGTRRGAVRVNDLVFIAAVIILLVEPILLSIVAAGNTSALSIGQLPAQRVGVAVHEVVYAPAGVVGVFEAFKEQSAGEDGAVLGCFPAFLQLHFAKVQLDVFGIVAACVANQAACSLAGCCVGVSYRLYLAHIQSGVAANTPNQQGRYLIRTGGRIDADTIQQYALNIQRQNVVDVVAAGVTPDQCAILVVVAPHGALQGQIRYGHCPSAHRLGEDARMHSVVLPIAV